ncbi:MAG: hypothetical protein ACRC53_05035 [Plesiomonas sp.]|uniref:hypothetical protein n=1 Tax=Plesiomonas sp. TaxID=2486279 RepID=UPI003F3AF32D
MAAEKLTRLRFIQIVFIMVFFLGLFVWRTFDNPVGKKITRISTACSLNEGACSLQESSTVVSASKVNIAKVTLSSLPPKAEYPLQLVITGVTKNTIVSAYVEGRDMFMGKIPVVFSFENGRWIGDFTVGSCTSEQMVWQVNITQGNTLSTVFFTVKRA